MAGINPFDLNRIMATMRARPPASVGGVGDFAIDFANPMQVPVRGAPMSDLAASVPPRAPPGFSALEEAARMPTRSANVAQVARSGLPFEAKLDALMEFGSGNQDALRAARSANMASKLDAAMARGSAVSPTAAVESWGTPGIKQVYGAADDLAGEMGRIKSPADVWKAFWSKQPNAPVTKAWSPKGLNPFDVLKGPASAAAPGVDPLAAMKAGAVNYGDDIAKAAAKYGGYFGMPTAGEAIPALFKGAGAGLKGALGIANKAFMPLAIGMGAYNVGSDLLDENSGLRQDIAEGNWGRALTGGALRALSLPNVFEMARQQGAAPAQAAAPQGNGNAWWADGQGDPVMGVMGGASMADIKQAYAREAARNNPQRAVAAAPAQSADPLGLGQLGNLTIPEIAQLAPFIRAMQPDPIKESRAEAMNVLKMQFMADRQAAGNDPKKLAAAQAAYSKGIIGLTQPQFFPYANMAGVAPGSAFDALDEYGG